MEGVEAQNLEAVWRLRICSRRSLCQQFVRNDVRTVPCSPTHLFNSFLRLTAIFRQTRDINPERKQWPRQTLTALSKHARTPRTFGAWKRGRGGKNGDRRGEQNNSSTQENLPSSRRDLVRTLGARRNSRGLARRRSERSRTLVVKQSLGFRGRCRQLSAPLRE